MKLCRSVFVAILFASALACATTVVQPTFNQLVDEADCVVVAEALSSASEWRTNASGGLIFTKVHFRIEESLKGKTGANLELSFLGGTVGTDTLEVSGMPRFDDGRRFILFVSSNRTEICPLVAMFHGKFNLQSDRSTGEEVVSRHDGSPVRVESPATPEKSSLLLRHLTVTEFKQRIRNRVNHAR